MICPCQVPRGHYWKIGSAADFLQLWKRFTNQALTWSVAWMIPNQQHEQVEKRIHAALHAKGWLSGGGLKRDGPTFDIKRTREVFRLGSAGSPGFNQAEDTM